MIKIGNSDFIILDGPIYFAYPGLFRQEDYAKVQRKLAEKRVNVLNKSKIPVVGIAKRIEKSKKLHKCRELMDLLNKEFNI